MTAQIVNHIDNLVIIVVSTKGHSILAQNFYDTKINVPVTLQMALPTFISDFCLSLAA